MILRTLHPSNRKHSSNRAGLAPLELVLGLPILLFTMGLMTILGTAGAWKIRANTNARQAVWRQFQLRDGDEQGNPDNWPQDAQMTLVGSNADIISTDPFEHSTVVRGPVISSQSGEVLLEVREGLLDMTAGTMTGFAEITRPFPVLRDLPPRQMVVPREEQVLDGTRFQYHAMGLGSNLARRTNFLYRLSIEAAPELPGLISTALTPLVGGDPEVYQLIGRTSPDFQPQIGLGFEVATVRAIRGRLLFPANTSDNVDLVRSQYVERLKQQIRRVPNEMTRYYISLYQSIIQRLEAQDPMPPGAAGLISELEEKIRQLNQFQAMLTP